jgi:hypothetical protein
MKRTIMASDFVSTRPSQEECGTGLQNQRPSLDDFVADLTEAAYPIALEYGGDERWLDLELDLWRVITQTVQKWQQRDHLFHL